MSETVLSQIENNILKLPVSEQLRLISRVAERLRRNVEPNTAFEAQLTEMAHDQSVQRELIEIERDFHNTEFDGLAE